MTPDTRKSYFLSIGLFCALLVTFLVPNVGSSRIIAAVLLLPGAVLISLLIKKRGILSINKGSVTLIMVVSAFLYLMFIYILGIYFGFYKYIGLSVNSFLKFTLPISIVIISVEIIRRALLSQEKKLTTVFAYLIALISDLLIVSNLWAVNSFNEFMNMVGLTFFPAAVGGILYHYLSRKYGAISVIPYRLIVSLYPYVLLRLPFIPDALLGLINILVPLALFLFVRAVFEKKPQRAAKTKSKWRYLVYALIAILMISTVMLISCKFKYGALVIGSESMTGTLNVGDTIIYEKYDGEAIQEGQIIVFQDGKVAVIHRVVDIERINGVTRYYTKGDANDGLDLGYRTAGDIIGTTKLKISLIGYPTLWLRSLFDR